MPGPVITSVGLKAATVAAVVAVKKTWTAVQGKITDRRMETLVEQVAREFEADPDGAQQRIEEALRTEWGYRLFEQTFRALMDSIHSRAEVAIAALMADYMKLERAPDREYQLAGGFLVGADEEVLRGALAVARQFVAVASAPLPSMSPVATHDTSYVLRGVGVSFGDEVWVHRKVFDGRATQATESNGEQCPKNLGIVLRLFERFEFGAPLDGQDTGPAAYEGNRHPSGGSVQLVALHGSEQRWRRLCGYLAVGAGV